MNRELVKAALRAPLFTLVAASTGLITLEATASGYKRASGSFIDDQFALGMEVQPSGFPQTAPGVVSGFTATTLSIKGGRTVATPAGSRAVIAGLPSPRAWDPSFTETPGIPFVDDEFTAPGRARDAIGDGGDEDCTGIYYVKPYCIANVGDEAIDRITDAILALYPIGQAWTLTDGSVLRIRGYDIGREVAPTAGGSPLLYNTGWRVLPVSIPWRVTSASV